MKLSKLAIAALGASISLFACARARAEHLQVPEGKGTHCFRTDVLECAEIPLDNGTKMAFARSVFFYTEVGPNVTLIKIAQVRTIQTFPFGNGVKLTMTFEGADFTGTATFHIYIAKKAYFSRQPYMMVLTDGVVDITKKEVQNDTKTLSIPGIDSADSSSEC